MHERLKRERVGRSPEGHIVTLSRYPKTEHFTCFRINGFPIFSNVASINEFILFAIHHFRICHAQHLLSFWLSPSTLAVGLARKNPGILPPGLSPCYYKRTGQGGFAEMLCKRPLKWFTKITIHISMQQKFNIK